MATSTVPGAVAAPGSVNLSSLPSAQQALPRGVPPSPVLARPAAPATATAPSADAVKAAAAAIDAFVRNSGRDIVFQVDKGTGQTVVSVRDAATGQTIRQIPSEEVLRIAQDLQQKQSPDGLLADTKA